MTMDMTEPPVWPDQDAVVLAGVAGGARRLDGLVASIDACDHDVPPYERVGPALGRLVGAGLIEPWEAGFTLTPFGRDLVRRARGRSIERVGEIEQLMQAVPVGPEVAVLTATDWVEAVATYQARFRPGLPGPTARAWHRVVATYRAWSRRRR